MNFYPHHIGDYLTATAHLTWLEDAAYRRLLDLYYSREQQIPSDLQQTFRLVRATSKEEKKAAETVLREFFLETANGWMHHRCEEEIIYAREAAERARVNGKKGGRPKKAKPKANPEITESVSDENPEITQSVFLGNPDITHSKAPNTNTNKEPTYGGSLTAPKAPSQAINLGDTNA